MSGKKNRRVEKLETGLTPKQAIMMWLQEAHAFEGIGEYVRHLKDQPDSAAPLHKLPAQVAEGVKVMPKEYLDAENYWVTDAFLDYVRPLIGAPLPRFASLI